jgi:hypothetical protein
MEGLLELHGKPGSGHVLADIRAGCRRRIRWIDERNCFVPLSDYAFYDAERSRWTALSQFSTNPAHGFRVFGSEAGAVTPADMIGDLRTYIGSANVAKGSAMSIDSKLQLALAALGSNDTTTGCLYLQDVINYTRAQSSKKVPTAVATEIISQATAIRTEIGC